MLLDAVPPARRAAAAVARALLVRVLAVAQRLVGALEREHDVLRAAARRPASHCDDRGVVRGGARERFERERAARLVADGAVVGAQLVEQRRRTGRGS